MGRTLRRVALVGSCTAVLGGISAGPALAATAQTCCALASNNAAVLYGYVDTGGKPAVWAFQWGRTTSYGSTAPTSGGRIGAGHGSPVLVYTVLRGLKPGTTYHFRLVAAGPGGTYYYYTIPSYGHDKSFRTNPNGKLQLVGRTLTVHGNRTSVGLRCLSKQTCSGTFTIKHGHTTCVSHPFMLRPGRTGRFTAKVSRGCLTALAKARKHRIGATFSASTRTGQPRLVRGVTLVRR